MTSGFRFHLRAIALVAILALLPATLVAQADSKIDLTGKWLFSVTTDAGVGTPTVTLKQQGDTVTGHYSSQALGEADLKGTAKDAKINFTFRTEVQGTALVVTYAGTIDSKDAMKGTIDIGGFGSGTFTAKRQ